MSVTRQCSDGDGAAVSERPAHDVCYWHKADMNGVHPDVRFGGKATSKVYEPTSANDPKGHDGQTDFPSMKPAEHVRRASGITLPCPRRSHARSSYANPPTGTGHELLMTPVAR
jgi:hypothetical protein